MSVMEDMFAGKVRRNLSGWINMVDWDHTMDATNGCPPKDVKCFG